jgi:hypothetical protein
MADKEKRLGSFKLRNVRLSFVFVFHKKEGKVDKVTGKKGRDTYQLAALIDKGSLGAENRAEMERVIAEVKAAKWGPDLKKQPKIKEKDLCYRDGDEENYDGYEGMMYVSLKNTDQPVLIDNVKDANGKWVKLTGDEGKLYSGCYGNIMGHVWAQDDPEYGKKINGSLDAVQFRAHGEKFGRGAVNVDESFDDDDVDGPGELDDEADSMV